MYNNYQNIYFKLFLLSFVGTILILLELASKYNKHISIANNLPGQKLLAPLEQVYLQASQLDNESTKIYVETFAPVEALDDPFSRISREFKIHSALKPRVQFWFDVYTKHSKNTYIIHHSDYPWIIFDIIDISPFFETRGPIWLRKQRGENYVETQKKLIKSQLIKLSKLKNYSKISQFEKKLLAKLKNIKGNKRKVFKMAAVGIRSQIGQRDFFLQGLEDSHQYLHLIEAEFTKLNLPRELTRIPFVESSFNVSAHSKVGASGVWQIMPHIGKKFSIVNPTIDERNSPVKATRIAGKLLKQNFQILKAWPLAVTAYNSGVGNLNKAVKKAKSRELHQIISYGPTGAFRFASSNFYASFLAALHAEVYQDEIFKNIAIERPGLIYKSRYKLNRSWKPHTLAKRIGIKIDTLLTLNLDLKKSIKTNSPLPKGYELFVPSNMIESVKSLRI
jgi:membrane-bound lytic murein transglycosylase D